MTEDVMDAIRKRRSIRVFAGREVPEATVTRVVEAGLCAPTAGNCQDWQFYVVFSAETRKELQQAAFGHTAIGSAPVVIVAAAELGRIAAKYGERGTGLYTFQGTAAAVQNMHLAAHAFGLGTCWVGAFDPAAVARVLGVDPKAVLPVAMVPMGYPEEEGKEPSRRPFADVVHVIR